MAGQSHVLGPCAPAAICADMVGGGGTGVDPAGQVPAERGRQRADLPGAGLAVHRVEAARRGPDEDFAVGRAGAAILADDQQDLGTAVAIDLHSMDGQWTTFQGIWTGDAQAAVKTEVLPTERMRCRCGQNQVGRCRADVGLGTAPASPFLRSAPVPAQRARGHGDHGVVVVEVSMRQRAMPISPPQPRRVIYRSVIRDGDAFSPRAACDGDGAGPMSAERPGAMCRAGSRGSGPARQVTGVWAGGPGPRRRGRSGSGGGLLVRRLGPMWVVGVFAGGGGRCRVGGGGRCSGRRVFW
ncbi:hypothetical protein SAMN05443665_103287 [Actinomadura meyerae]|uniref:Uncharacterized protein n=1 Tax=Actinomadura meyerae TaxID=240840 RepID=A0A239MVX8_9ACTN|nr:hypothetical protein SAMN05443665_103287 [Actinomadura meyerae]